jgi:hypothetical protein
MGIRGVDGSYLLSITALHPFVVDEKTSWLGVFPAIRSHKLDREIRHLV